MTSIVQLNMRADALLYAIDSYNVNKVRNLLAQHEDLHPEYKQSLVRVARQSAHAAKAKVGFFSSGIDFLKLVTGMGLTGVGCTGLGVAGFVQLYKEPKTQKATRILTNITLGSGVATLGGLVLMYKGWTLSTAKARLRKAREIEAMIAIMPEHRA